MRDKFEDIKKTETPQHCNCCGAPIDLNSKCCPYCGVVYRHILFDELFSPDDKKVFNNNLHKVKEELDIQYVIDSFGRVCKSMDIGQTLSNSQIKDGCKIMKKYTVFMEDNNGREITMPRIVLE